MFKILFQAVLQFSMFFLFPMLLPFYELGVLPTLPEFVLHPSLQYFQLCISFLWLH